MIALNEKGVPYTLHETAIQDPKSGLWLQLDEKPKWFLELSPLGKVPALAWKEGDHTHRVYESLICNEFLEDYSRDTPKLLPEKPVEKAHARIVIDRVNGKLVPLFYRILVRQDKQQQQECAEQISSEMLWLESQCHATGPCYLGKDFSLADAALLPWFLRLYILEHYRGYKLPAECKRLSRWWQDMAKRPSVTATQKAPDSSPSFQDQLLHDHYSKYADASANSTSARDFK